MQFVTNGPNIPDHLLQSHEDGHVVFFCGAGISYPAGLPNFKGLVDEIYRSLGTSLNELESDSYSKQQYDTTIDLLEHRWAGGRVAVRSTLPKILEPYLRKRGATAMHHALLTLGTDRDGVLRVVTTNFDRVFEKTGKLKRKTFKSYCAPLIPIPKKSRWDGLVYLHGKLESNSSESDLNKLVLSSGDFGLAYLTERWASRFVTELFRNFVVCFVGYSINDPVLRYMMDALAADRMLGERTPQAYAFGDYKTGQEPARRKDWEAKGVIPILYEVPAQDSRDHSALHNTLSAWANIYRDGVTGKEKVVVEHAVTHPSESTQQDNFVGRMIWAISHRSGLPAKQFSNLNPVPPLDWLESFSENRYSEIDLGIFDIEPDPKQKSDLSFSLVHRPASYIDSPWMALMYPSTPESNWDKVMYEIAFWLTRHLNDPKLIQWVIKNGGRVSEKWRSLIDRRLQELTSLEVQGDLEKLEEISRNSPQAIPDKATKLLWELILSNKVKQNLPNRELFDWISRFKQEGLTTTLRIELRELLSPVVKLSEPFNYESLDESDEE